MNNRGSFGGKEYGVKSYSIMFLASGVAANINQSTNYFFRCPTTQSGWSASEESQATSPIDGFIVGVSSSLKITGVVKTDFNTLYMRIRGRKKLYMDDSTRVRTVIVSNTYQLNGSYGKFFSCRIPIYKGEMFQPLLRTAAYGAAVTNLTCEMVVFIEGA